jgi:predicted ATPase with chaperone activity
MVVTLANHGVLFLDELAEFIAPVLYSPAAKPPDVVSRSRAWEASVAFSATVTVRRHAAFTEIPDRAYVHQSA